MTNSTSTDVTFEGAFAIESGRENEDYHSTAPEDKQINE